MEIVRGSKLQPEGKARRPHGGDRRCHCGRKISVYNPNKTCWQHAPIDYGRIRGRQYDGKKSG